MKKFLTLLLTMAALVLAGLNASAQGRFGVIGGITFSNAEKQSLNRSTMNKYHVGVTYQLRLPLGFSVQPLLQYHVKGAKLGNVLGMENVQNTCDLTVGYLELPVSFQWGPDLLLFRPFLDVTPYIGYGLNNRMDVYVAGHDDMPEFSKPYKNTWAAADLNRWEYGVGVGIGLEIWKFQVIGRYNWNLGSLYKSDMEFDPDQDFMLAMMRRAFSNGHNLGGFTLSVSLLF